MRNISGSRSISLRVSVVALANRVGSLRMGVSPFRERPESFRVGSHVSGNRMRTFRMGIPDIGDRVPALHVDMTSDSPRRTSLDVLSDEIRDFLVPDLRKTGQVHRIVVRQPQLRKVALRSPLVRTKVIARESLPEPDKPALLTDFDGRNLIFDGR